MTRPSPGADDGRETDPAETLARRVRAVDAATLTPVVRVAVGDATATLTEWSRERLKAGAGGGYGGTGIWRFQGVASVETGESRENRENGEDTENGERDRYDGEEACVDWAVVLKTVVERPWERPTDPAYWHREASVYRSGVVRDAPGLSVPRCFGVREFEGEGCWLWLEDLSEGALRGPDDTLASRRATGGGAAGSRGARFGDGKGDDGAGEVGDAGSSDAPQWTLDDFEHVARDLGRFNAHFASNPVDPRPEWLAVRGFDFRQAAPTVALADALPDDDLVRAAFPGEQREALFDVWEAREALLGARAELPNTLCHFDAYPRNLFLRAGEDGLRTVAVDWDQLAEGAVGENAAALVVLSLVWADFDPERGDELADAVFAAYVDGLRAGGWSGDRSDVRLGFDCHLVLRWLEFVGRHVRCLADPVIQDWLADLMGRSVAEMRAALPAINRLAFKRFDAVEDAVR